LEIIKTYSLRVEGCYTYLSQNNKKFFFKKKMCNIIIHKYNKTQYFSLGFFEIRDDIWSVKWAYAKGK